MGPIVGAIIGVWLFEGYSILTKRFANLSNIASFDSMELHPKVPSIDDDDKAMITPTPVRS